MLMGNMRGQTASTRDQFKIAPVAAGEAVHDFFAKAMHEREISALEQYSDNRVESGILGSAFGVSRALPASRWLGSFCDRKI